MSHHLSHVFLCFIIPLIVANDDSSQWSIAARGNVNPMEASLELLITAADARTRVPSSGSLSLQENCIM